MSWFPLYVNDWLGSKAIRRMTNEQRGAYITLLVWQWNSDDNRLDDISEIRELCGLDLRCDEHSKLLEKFEQPDGFYDAKLREVWEKQSKSFTRMSEGGRKGGLKGGSKGGVKHPEPDPEPEPEPDIPPIPPQGEVGEGKKKPKLNKRRLSQTDKKRVKVDANSDMMKRIGSWFGRSPDTLWNIYESDALLSLSPPEPEIQIVETYYTAHRVGDKDYRRKNVETLLNNWSGELDRATAFAGRNHKRGGVKI